LLYIEAKSIICKQFFAQNAQIKKISAQTAKKQLAICLIKYGLNLRFLFIKNKIRDIFTLKDKMLCII